MAEDQNAQSTSPRDTEIASAKAKVVTDQISLARQEIGAVVKAFNAVVVRARVLKGYGLLEPGALTDDMFVGANAAISAGELLDALGKLAALDTYAEAQGISAACIKVAQ